MKLFQPESVEEIELVEYAEKTEKSRNAIKVSEILYFHFRGGEADETINMKEYFF